MTRAYNFGAGPAMLPEAVLQQTQQELLDWQDSGMSIIEVGHRSPPFRNLVIETEQAFRQLLAIPDNYHVLFMHGGARAQFAAVPLNLLGDKTSADYLDIGSWSTKAATEADKYCRVNIVASSREQNYTTIPNESDWQLNADAAYFHYTPNETIHGLMYPQIPDVGNVPLVADMTSYLLSGPLDISKYGVIYAACQKNISCSGLTVVIVRDDLLNRAAASTPSFLQYKLQVQEHSLYNTPPTFAIYLANLMCQWAEGLGGLDEIAKSNQQKAAMLYQTIDNSGGFYTNNIETPWRSQSNIIFQLASTELEQQFLSQASAQNLLNLKGHRELGGMRASLYNSMPKQGVMVLCEFMLQFQQKYC